MLLLDIPVSSENRHGGFRYLTGVSVPDYDSRTRREIVVPSVHDVAAYILTRRSPITAMKLEKLVYYCQAWSLVWDEEPLFPELIRAWANGPVVRELYDHHRGMFKVSAWQWGNPGNLTANQRDTVDRVLDYYGKMSSLELSNLTHNERPWRDARRGIGPGERANVVIPLSSIDEYYSSLV